MAPVRALPRPVTAAAVAFLAAAGLGLEGKKADPWEVPAPDYALLQSTLKESRRSYDYYVALKVPDAARRPARIEPPMTKEDRAALKSLRDLMGASSSPVIDGVLRKRIAENPALHDAHTLLAESLLRQKKPAEAAVALRDGLIGNRRNPEAWRLLEEAATAIGRRVVRPSLPPRGWVLGRKDGSVQVGYAGTEGKSDLAWNAYAAARAVYRYEGTYDIEFPGKEYRFTFREQLFAAGAAARCAEASRMSGATLEEDLTRLLEERKGKGFVPFVYFAMYTEPLPAEPEREFELLRPSLEKYFDERILVRK
jgi:hypothetical protein